VVKLGAVTHIRGTVTDADTGKPVEDFHATAGIFFSEGQPIAWQPQWDVNFENRGGGHFDLQNDFPYPGIAIRIEAKGHLPVESRVVKSDEGDAELDLKMKPGKDVLVTVHAADGSLVSGAVGVMGLPRQMAFIQNSRQVMNRGTPQVTSGADGVIDFPPASGKFKIAVFADAGYAEVDQDALAKSSNITLAPWGRIEGKLMIGSQPGSGKNLDLYPQIQQTGYEPDEIRIQDGLSATADADGSCAIDRVPPGTWTVARRVQISTNMSSDASLQTVDVAPGKTVTVNVGGTGRPVVGKVVLAPSLAARTDWQYGFCQIVTRNNVVFEEPPMPFLVRLLPMERQQQWMQNWLKTDDGKVYMANRQKQMAGLGRYPLPIGADGLFRVDDVPAGHYEISISLQHIDPQRGYGQQIGMGGAEFTVPEMPGGRSDEPLQIDPVDVVSMEKYKVGDTVYDLTMRTPDGKDLKISDFHGKYLLLDFYRSLDASTPSFKQIYAEYPPDERLALLTIIPGMVPPGQTPGKIDDNPWHEASIVMQGQINWAVLNNNFGGQNPPGTWLIGPDGKIVAEDLAGDGIQAAVTAAIGAPAPMAVPATQPTTAP
jgi:hypothetical protein